MLLISVTACKSRERLNVLEEKVGNQYARYRDTHICDVENGPVGKLNKVDHMALQELWSAKDTISEIAENSSQENSKTHHPSRFYDFSGKDDQSRCHDDRETGEK